ncbi:tyrosine--tRNA ligase [Clostridium sp. CAG:354]|jgi:tyrosyl-tRNA synthetase|uniref:tyrosine--tRNA ligase n=1 Tax=Candidatus Merdicola sp. TaxID=3085652 RepID=UPI00033DEFFD|nr:tyrosine--tRNA ligase [Clostridia bacterium]CDE10816.1 tyrosine--tRNA ligase [Clostridium sp. CAG:354]
MSNIFEELTQRGYTEQLTHPEEIKNLLDNESISFYIGFDPTADSLHVGHFISLMVASHMQKAGHRPIILIGGGTATIGDPSGKTDMRRMMSREEIDHNVECFKKQIAKFLSFEGENAAIIVNNADWLLDLKFINFAREIGSLFSVNKMLAAECYKQRMERGLTFFELSYMLMQSYDFLYLHDKYGCKLQMGGNDQWSNILGGVDLIRRIGHSDSYGLTFKLLTTKEGKKMGKTEKGALWLDATKTSPYDFYQYWRNIDDADVKTVLSLLTFLPMEKVEELSNLKDEKINEAKKVAAYEITKLIHGEEEAKKAEEASNALFGGQGSLDNMPTATVASNISILDAIIQVGFAPSKGQARQLITQGGISLNDTKISDTNYVLSDTDFKDGFAILKKGKKSYYKLQK